MRTRLLSIALAAFALLVPCVPCARACARGGGQLPEIELSDFAQTKAKSFDDFAGRTVLIEFFAYW